MYAALKHSVALQRRAAKLQAVREQRDRKGQAELAAHLNLSSASVYAALINDIALQRLDAPAAGSMGAAGQAGAGSAGSPCQCSHHTSRAQFAG